MIQFLYFGCRVVLRLSGFPRVKDWMGFVKFDGVCFSVFSVFIRFQWFFFFGTELLSISSCPKFLRLNFLKSVGVFYSSSMYAVIVTPVGL